MQFIMHEQELFCLGVMNQSVIIKSNKEFSFQLTILSSSYPSMWGVIVHCGQTIVLLHAATLRVKRKEEGHRGRNENFLLEMSYHVLLVSQSNTVDVHLKHSILQIREVRLENMKFLIL